jgi:peptidyl-prolyl cis-trans isomerase D
MFDYIRNNTRLMGFLLALFIVPAFVLVGVDGYSNMGGRGETVATVGGQPVKRDEWDAAHRREVDRIRASQPNIDIKLLDTDAAKYATLERLVRERVLLVSAEKMNLVTSDQKLARDLQQNEFIASLRRPDGTLDMDRYRQVLAGQGLSPEMFELQVRQDLSQRQVSQGVVASAFATPASARASLQAFFERREVQLARFDTAAYQDKVQVDDAEVAAYYNANPAQFQAEEEADVEYLVLNLDSVAQGLVVSDADIAAYYQQNADRYASKEERRASHILINAAANAPAAEREAAKAKAAELLAQATAAPAAFAELARKNSQDPGSAPGGGDLGFFQRGAMVKPFEDAAFSLAKGALSGVVESEFGYHVILVTDIKPSVARPLAQVKSEIEAELKKQMAQREFAEKADVFGNMVYEQANALAPVADKLKLKLQTVNSVKRQPVPGLPPALANEKLLTALFSSDSVDKKNNTEAVETAANQLVAARILAHRPAHTLVLNEVKARVTALLKAQKAQAMARQEGEKALAEGKAGAGVKLQAAVVASRDKPQGLQPQELTAALRAETSTLPAWVGVDLGARGYSVIKVLKSMEREAPPADLAAQELQQYNQWWASAEGQAYYKLLKKRLKVDIKIPQPSNTPSKQG